jgi:hypothetical protein
MKIMATSIGNVTFQLNISSGQELYIRRSNGNIERWKTLGTDVHTGDDTNNTVAVFHDNFEVALFMRVEGDETAHTQTKSVTLDDISDLNPDFKWPSLEVNFDYKGSIYMGTRRFPYRAEDITEETRSHALAHIKKYCDKHNFTMTNKCNNKI